MSARGSGPGANHAAPPVVLGRVVGAHGVRGQVRVRYFGDGPQSLLDQDVVWLASEATEASGATGATGKVAGRSGLAVDLATPGGAVRHEVLASGSGRANEVRLTLEGVDGREQAEALRGQLVAVPATALESLPEGEFYWHQLLGCRVKGSDGTLVGTVRDLMETGAHDVLVVEDAEGRRHLIPAADELVHDIDLEAGEIVVEILPGLLDGS
ncbi:MAG: ribosome maturation factor RimM [Myxococcota bacterium]